MKLYVKTNGKILGPLDFDKILLAVEKGRFSEDTTVSDDRVNWLSMEDARSLLEERPLRESTAPAQPQGSETQNHPTLRLRENTAPEQSSANGSSPIILQPLDPTSSQSGLQMPPQGGYPQQPGYPQPNDMGQPNMNQFQPMPPPKQEEAQGTTGALIWGIASLIAWIIPLIGLPVSITGLVIGIKRKFTLGIVLSIIGLILTIGCAIWGAYKGAKGELFSRKDNELRRRWSEQQSIDRMKRQMERDYGFSFSGY